MMSSIRRSSLAWLWAALWLLPWVGPARAQTDTLRAEQLFLSGRAALNRGELEVACEELSESFRLEAATGSLLALAVCQERLLRLVQAQASYRQVLSRSLEEGRADRARAALAKVEELEKRISTLTIYSTLAEDSGRLTVRVNGEPLPDTLLGTKLPIDGSVVVVDASAPGKQAWRGSVSNSREGQTLYLTIPLLVAEPASRDAPPVPATVQKQAAPQPRTEPARPRPSRSKAAGLALLAGSAALLSVSAGYTFRATRLDRDSNASCDANRCDDAGTALRLDARRAGNVATGTLVGGAALGAAGLLTFLLGRRAEARERRPLPALRLGGWLTAHGAGAVVLGSYR